MQLTACFEALQPVGAFAQRITWSSASLELRLSALHAAAALVRGVHTALAASGGRRAFVVTEYMTQAAGP